MPNMIMESDGHTRPEFAPVATTRPTVAYTYMGRVIAGGRVFMVRDTVGGMNADRLLGWLFVMDDGRLFASPDNVKNGAYWRLRWVGGMLNRQECVQFLRGARYVTSEWWDREGKELAQAE